MSLPSMLQYSSIKPKGFPSKFIRWEQFPQTTISNNFNKNEVVRFLFQTDKFIDPYQSYIEIEITQPLDPFLIDTKGASMPVLCLDGQSTSLISEMRIFSNTKEIERIQEYDQLGCILHDLNMQSGHKAARSYEGMKYVDGGNYSKFNTPQQPLFKQVSGKRTAIDVSYSGYGCVGITPYSIPGFNAGSVSYQWAANVMGYGLTGNISGLSMAAFFDPASLSPSMSFGGMTPANQGNEGIDYYLQQGGFSLQNGSGLSYNTCNYNYARSVLAYDSNFGGDYLECYHSGLNYGMAGGNAVHGTSSGLYRPYAPFSADDNVDMIIPGFEVLTVVNGKTKHNTIHRQTDPNQLEIAKTVSVKNYMIPILSGVLGALIPSSEWRLIPGKAFGQLMFEFYLNQNAFFYSGVKSEEVIGNNNSVYSETANSSQWPLSWKVTKMSIHFDLWSFDDAVHQTIDSLLASEGIILSSTSWTLGPTYSISNTQSVVNNWQINNGIPSVKMFFFWFLHNGYQQYNFLRKQYRVSQNITSIQFKIGQDYIPPTAITGHAGNIGRNGVIKADNTNFLMELHRNSNSFFNQHKSSKISAFEFAINDRWNPRLGHNIANQTPLFHETRMRGKALYTIDTSANPYDQTVFSGLDTTTKRPIELVLQADSADPLMDPTTMYTMFYHDFVVIFKIDGVQTMGSG